MDISASNGFRVLTAGTEDEDISHRAHRKYLKPRTTELFSAADDGLEQVVESI
jgi:hypothetical protein